MSNNNRYKYSITVYRYLLGAIFMSFSLLLIPGSTKAQEDIVNITLPTFPKCTNPQGAIKVSYQNGIHGIPGDQNTYLGEDTVYSLTEDTLSQCFCAINGDGIQTNWWKVSSITLDQIEVLVSQNWIYIPNGALWGLDESPYMAKNSTYECDDNNDDPKDSKKDKKKNNDDDDDDDDNRIGSILGSYDTRFGDVLGLASTGNARSILVKLILGTGLTTTAIVIYIKKRK